MNTFTAFFWKEWRSQRAVLLAFVAMAFTAVALVYSCASPQWLTDPRIASTVVGMAGVLFVVVPQAVLCEFSNKDDQFLRRLPGALPVAFAAKALFVLLAALALPCVGRLLGDALINHGVRDDYATLVAKDLAQVVPGYVVALPLVLAFAFMLPGARMAVGAAAVFALGLGAAVYGLARSNPRIDVVLASPMHVPVFAAVALVAAFVACVFGRRGGNHWRSAKLGAATLALGLLPHAVWLGATVQRYRHPDPNTFVIVETCGVSPDARTALVRGSDFERCYGCVFRVDLTSGATEQLTLPQSMASACDFVQPTMWTSSARRRFWSLIDGDGEASIFDIASGTRAPAARDKLGHPLGPTRWRADLLHERRATTLLWQPGGRRVWIADDQIYFEERDDSVTSMPWKRDDNHPLRAGGHGILGWPGVGRVTCFDLVHRRFVALPCRDFIGPVGVAGTWLCRSEKGGGWLRVDGATDAQEPLPFLTAYDDAQGLLDDASALIVHYHMPYSLRAFKPATGGLQTIALQAPLPEGCRVSDPRPFPERVCDPAGRRWVLVTLRDGPTPRAVAWHSALLAVDPRTLTSQVMLTSDEERLDVIAFDSDHTVLVDEGHRRLVRLDTATGERTVLLPRR